jgi:molybdopterin converting factor small subunit
MSAGAWIALASWLAVAALIAALLYAWRQYQRVRDQNGELTQPNVAMFMEPSATDWHLIELVVKNFGRTPAFGIRFEFANPPTVGRYESASYEDRYIDITELNLPSEIPYLAPTQEWRIVWDSALDRRELGEAIASRFHGAVTYYDEPKSRDTKQKRYQYRSSAVLDWSTLHPVERLELLTTHDLARQEKQKLELLRHLLSYYHYAAGESREEVLRAEINRVRAAADELRDRYRAESTPAADNDHEHDVNNNIDFDEAHTTIINGRHRRHLM